MLVYLVSGSKRFEERTTAPIMLPEGPVYKQNREIVFADSILVQFHQLPFTFDKCMCCVRWPWWFLTEAVRIAGAGRIGTTRIQCGNETQGVFDLYSLEGRH